MLMSDSDYEDVILFNRVEYLVGELVQRTFPDLPTLDRPRFRILGDPECSLPDLFLESLAKASVLKLIVARRVLQLSFGQG
jgi:hypothetical protein